MNVFFFFITLFSKSQQDFFLQNPDTAGGSDGGCRN